ncbi:hypothetical protein C8R34_11179 [Nitrosomonas sp. Nm84]|nr:hypothetical protein C8R34_11179 [Nitrosomonas sp. Nm84]
MTDSNVFKLNKPKRPLQNHANLYFDVISRLFLLDRVIFSHFPANEPGIITLTRVFPVKRTQYPYVCVINWRSAKSWGSLFKLYVLCCQTSAPDCRRYVLPHSEPL